MGRITRMTVSLPSILIDALDQRLVHDGEGRSAVIRRLIETALRQAEEQEEIARYIRGYAEQPQTEDECGWSDHVAREALAEVPWE